MPTFPPPAAFADLIRLAKLEDLGPASDDPTSRICIPAKAQATGTVVQKQTGVVSGLPIIAEVCRAYDQSLKVELLATDGEYSDARLKPLARITGPYRSLLSAERVLLNFLQHLSGVATMAHRFAREVQGTAAVVIDTRKTLPGYRALDKYAVVCGGGGNHRTGLYDMVLAKDNHLAAFAAGTLRQSVERVVAEAGELPVEIEVDTFDQFRDVLSVPGVDFILLDNMDNATMRRCVELRNAAPNKPLLEASGNVNLSTIRGIAETGVDRISIGAITHSAPALDIGLDVVAE